MHTNQHEPPPTRSERLAWKMRRLRGLPGKYTRLALSFTGKRALLPLARLCMFKGTSEWCWICGGAAGMGPWWNGSITCWDCSEKWEPSKRAGFIVDWRGLGRLTPELKAKAWEAFVPMMVEVREGRPLYALQDYDGARVAALERRGLIKRGDAGWRLTLQGRIVLRHKLAARRRRSA